MYEDMIESAQEAATAIFEAQQLFTYYQSLDYLLDNEDVEILDAARGVLYDLVDNIRHMKGR